MIYFPSRESFGPFAFDTSTTTPAKMYVYHERFSDYVGKTRLWSIDKAGTLTDGPITNYLQTLTTNPDLSTGVLEYDADPDSPYQGDARVSFDMA